MSELPFDIIRDEIQASRSASSVRNYLAMVSRLEDFTGTSALSLSEVDSSFVNRFSDFLLANGLTPSSAHLYQKMLRAILKPHYPREARQQWKAAFANVTPKRPEAVSKKNESRPSLTADHLRALLDLRLEALPRLDKIRDIFLYSRLSGVTDLQALKRLAEADGLPAVTGRQRDILRNYRQRHGLDMRQTILNLSEKDYLHLLDLISEKAHIPSLLPIVKESRRLPGNGMEEPDSGTVGTLGIENPQFPFSILNFKNRWYAMSGHDGAAATLRILHERLGDTAGNIATITLDTAASQPGIKRMMEGLLFFRATSEEARRIKRAMAMDAYIYSAPGTKTPSPIPEGEMHTFLLLLDIAPDTIELHFPRDPKTLDDKRPGLTATITKGNFSGQVGIIRKVDADAWEIELEFSSLGGYRVRATVPAEFVTPKQ